MINSIKIKEVASYCTQGITIENLGKINFIYGANGCGKTTISNFIHDNTDQKFLNCSLDWQNDMPLKVLVYNTEFRKRNFGKGKLNGVFTLGKATADQIKEIEKKMKSLNL